MRLAYTNFPATPLFVYQPRVSAAYQLPHKTAVHFGFGVFDDIVPAQIADLASVNPPYSPVFVGGLGGQVGGIAVAPGVSGSAIDAASAANQSFQTAFRTGADPCTGIAAGAPVCPLAVSLNTFPTGTLKVPYYYQYSLGAEHQVGPRGAVRVDYVGTGECTNRTRCSSTATRTFAGMFRALFLPAAVGPKIRQRQ